MAGPINLRTARKARARLKKRQQGDENALKHGRTKAQRAAEAARAVSAVRHLDGHRRDHPDDTEA